MKESVRVVPEIQLFSGLTQAEISSEMKEKQEVLKWLLKNDVRTTDKIGRVVVEYYVNEEKVLTAMKKNSDPEGLFK